MISGSKKIALGLAMIVLTTLACGLPAGATPTPTAATQPPTAVPATATPVAATVPPTPSLPVVASPQIDSLHMLDAMNGWAITDTNLLRTPDGGTTWYNATPTGLTSLGYSASAYYLDASTAWVAMMGSDPTNGTLYRTTDGGSTWTSISVPFGGGWLKFMDKANGWVLVGLSAGMSHQAVAVFTTSDGGSTWSQVFTFVTDEATVSGSNGTRGAAGAAPAS